MLGIVLSTLHLLTHLILPTALWGRTVIRPILQMRKPRHRRLSLRSSQPLRGRAGIQTIAQHCSPTIGQIYILLFALSMRTYDLSCVNAQAAETVFLTAAKYSKWMDYGLLGRSPILDLLPECSVLYSVNSTVLNKLSWKKATASHHFPAREKAHPHSPHHHHAKLASASH